MTNAADGSDYVQRPSAAPPGGTPYSPTQLLRHRREPRSEEPCTQEPVPKNPVPKNPGARRKREREAMFPSTTLSTTRGRSIPRVRTTREPISRSRISTARIRTTTCSRSSSRSHPRSTTRSKLPAGQPESRDADRPHQRSAESRAQEPGSEESGTEESGAEERGAVRPARVGIRRSRSCRATQSRPRPALAAITRPGLRSDNRRRAHRRVHDGRAPSTERDDHHGARLSDYAASRPSSSIRTATPGIPTPPSITVTILVYERGRGLPLRAGRARSRAPDPPAAPATNVTPTTVRAGQTGDIPGYTGHVFATWGNQPAKEHRVGYYISAASTCRRPAAAARRHARHELAPTYTRLLQNVNKPPLVPGSTETVEIANADDSARHPETQQWGGHGRSLRVRG